MQSICFCLVVLAIYSVNAQVKTFTDPNNPIKRVEYTVGANNVKLVKKLHAEIRASHYKKNDRHSFTKSGEPERIFRATSAPGDERGHLVASMFSGPTEWYNLSAQSKRVNRNVGSRWLITDWYGCEAEVRDFLEGGENRCVSWDVDVNYGDAARPNRPKSYRLRINYYENGRHTGAASDTTLQNSSTGEPTCHALPARKNVG